MAQSGIYVPHSMDVCRLFRRSAHIQMFKNFLITSSAFWKLSEHSALIRIIMCLYRPLKMDRLTPWAPVSVVQLSLWKIRCYCQFQNQHLCHFPAAVTSSILFAPFQDAFGLPKWKIRHQAEIWRACTKESCSQTKQPDPPQSRPSYIYRACLYMPFGFQETYYKTNMHTLLCL